MICLDIERLYHLSLCITKSQPSLIHPFYGAINNESQSSTNRSQGALYQLTSVWTTIEVNAWIDNHSLVKRVMWLFMLFDYSKSAIFIRPFEKRTYYAMAMSVRLSVRPSVRPSFQDFFSTCFEISIWNLVYAFSRWHYMSSLSFITIGSLWPSLQPKVGQTQFLQSWPYKSR